MACQLQESGLTLGPLSKKYRRIVLNHASSIILQGEMSERSKEHAWKACIRLTTYRGFESLSLRNKYEFIVASVGPFATISCEPRQVRKEATVAADAGAGVWLVLATISLKLLRS